MVIEPWTQSPVCGCAVSAIGALYLIEVFLSHSNSPRKLTALRVGIPADRASGEAEAVFGCSSLEQKDEK